MTSVTAWFSFAACTTPRRIEGKHSQLADRQPAVRRTARPRAERFAAARVSTRLSQSRIGQPNKTTKPCVGLREGQPVSPQKLLDALQLAHLVEQPDNADAAGSLSRLSRLTSLFKDKVPGAATRACLTRCWPMLATSAVISARVDQTKARRVFATPSAKSNSASSKLASAASCKVGGRR